MSGMHMERQSMRIPRRRFLSILAGAAVLPTIAPIARSEAYPARPVRLVVPQAAGGAADISARLIGQWLSERLSQTFVVENKPGAGGNIGTEAVVGAPADGYTLLLAGSFNAINATLYPKLNFNFIRDIEPVAGIMRNPLIMEVNASVPAGSVAEFIAYAKANPGKLNMGSAGKGSPQHMAGELFKMMAGVDIVHVPYRGAAAMLTDLMRGELHVAFDPMLSSLELIKVGKLRALAVTTASRSDALPDTPTVGEFVPGYESFGWVGIGVPKQTPPQVVGKLASEINAGLADARVITRLGELGGTALTGSSVDFAKLISEQTERWAAVIRAANLRPD
jgi:tripartite-type tricarboxylate transporter receptor subunit TctC